MARPCKICKLKKTNKKSYKKITDHIKNGKISTAKFIKKFNKDFSLNIIPMNVVRHKTHIDGQVIEIKEEELKKTKPITRQNNTALSGMSLLPDLDPKHEKFLLYC